MNNIQIIINGQSDRKIIEAAATASLPYFIDIINNILPDAPATSTLDILTMDSSYVEAFKKVIDTATFEVEAGVLVWNIYNDGRDFSLTDSYVRNSKDTSGTLTAISDGQPIKMRIEIPGFSSSNFREIDLWYNQDFNPTDLDLMLEIGVTITGNGANFNIANTIDCKMSFSKPTAITDTYFVNFPTINDIITP